MSRLTLSIYAILTLFIAKILIKPDIYSLVGFGFILLYKSYLIWIDSRDYRKDDEETLKLRDTLQKDRLRLEMAELQALAAKKATSYVKDPDKRIVF